jgi:hypothetical protein
MNDLDLTSILYISYRLAPFILVSFFSLSSIFNKDFKGLIYLSGLLLASFISVMIGNTFTSMFQPSGGPPDMYQQTTQVCNLLTLSKSGPISSIPLSLVVFTYTFGYLLTVIVKYKLEKQNIHILVLFPLIILTDMIWNAVNGCAKPLAALVAIILGGLSGVAWAFLIDSLKLTKLQYFNGVSNKESCSVPSKQTFRCTIKSG